ncbi:hypothetical protein ONA70_35105 [Micromonospora yasonensis]|uniref:hypothetical protein n=1 Tax=Micromonospora yasonensis TaxID=1128667 RepID=UPI00222EBF75|nr:hypothetical protein [Micromonospora yasonensis]MCW3845304.1 hypothetical protein [Micromonospora yasonensis]
MLAHAGAARVAHNWALARVKAVWDQRAAERSYGVAEEALTPTVGWSLPVPRKAWNAAKDDVAPWWRECSKEAFNTGLDALARALKSWPDSRSGRRAGRKVGFPRFKSKRRSTPTVRFTTGAIRIEPGRKHVVLPRLGRLKLHESARKLARRLEAGAARIMSATLRRDGGRWHVAFTVGIDPTVRCPAQPGTVVGVDVGITHQQRQVELVAGVDRAVELGQPQLNVWRLGGYGYPVARVSRTPPRLPSNELIDRAGRVLGMRRRRHLLGDGAAVRAV